MIKIFIFFLESIQECSQLSKSCYTSLQCDEEIRFEVHYFSLLRNRSNIWIIWQNISNSWKVSLLLMVSSRSFSRYELGSFSTNFDNVSECSVDHMRWNDSLHILMTSCNSGRLKKMLLFTVSFHSQRIQAKLLNYFNDLLEHDLENAIRREPLRELKGCMKVLKRRQRNVIST